jgi:uncharacterized membrane protein
MLFKILHYLAFSVAIGGGVANMILGIRASKNAESAPHLRGAQRAIGTGALLAIALLWATGLSMWVGTYGVDAKLGGSFHIKLTAATLLTLLSGYAFVRGRNAAKGGAPLAPKTARLIGATTLALAVVAVTTAVMTFER